MKYPGLAPALVSAKARFKRAFFVLLTSAFSSVMKTGESFNSIYHLRNCFV
jgi:hypothetical protein